MTRDELGVRVRVAITEHMAGTYRGDRGSPEVTDASDLIDGLQLDSLDFIEITMDLEDKLDIEINDERVSNIVTVRQMVDYLAELVGIEAVPA